MDLRLFLEKTGQKWILKQGRVYTIGSEINCDVTVPSSPEISGNHLNIRFDQSLGSWLVEALDPTCIMLMDGVSKTSGVVQKETQIQLSNEIVFTARPEAIEPRVPTSPPPYVPPAPQNYAQTQAKGSSYSTNTVRNDGFREVVRSQNDYARTNPSISSVLPSFTWPQYVKTQVDQHEGLFMRLATRFALITGMRQTPWILQSKDKGIEGYVIPDFKGSVDAVVQAIESQVGKLREYDDTDCIASSLTDAHIADTGSENAFTGVELFAIRRGKNATRGDYRRFCVTSYHRVRSYVIVERYGPDLFVSWITRFEPTPTPAVMQILLIVAIFLTLLFLFSSNLGLIIAPLTLWAEIYLLVPAIMESFGILPKKANASQVIGLVVIPTIFILFIVMSMQAMNSMSRF